MTRLDKAVDTAIARENARALADQEQLEADRELGDRYRRDLEQRGILSPWHEDPLENYPSTKR